MEIDLEVATLHASMMMSLVCRQSDFNQMFDYTSDTSFASDCMEQTRGTVQTLTELNFTAGVSLLENRTSPSA